MINASYWLVVADIAVGLSVNSVAVKKFKAKIARVRLLLVFEYILYYPICNKNSSSE